MVKIEVERSCPLLAWVAVSHPFYGNPDRQESRIQLYEEPQMLFRHIRLLLSRLIRAI